MRFSIFIFFVFFDAGFAKKYRSEKINYIYDKAINHIKDRQKLARLEKDLSGYDDIYMDTKDRHGHGKVDNLNKKLLKLDEKLMMVLGKYGVDNILLTLKEKMKLKNEWEYTEENLPLPSEKFTDERLQNLWQKAQHGKFSEGELYELHKELKEVERKIRVYEDHLEEFSKVPHENSIHFDDDFMTDKTKKLKIANKDMNNHLEQVHMKVTNEEYSPFSETKVKRLWKMAQDNSKFSIHDLNIIKDELSHFENQLKKVDFHQKEIIALKEILKAEGKSELANIEGVEMDARHEKLNRKVRKLEKYLEKKVHTEL